MYCFRSSSLDKPSHQTNYQDVVARLRTMVTSNKQLRSFSLNFQEATLLQLRHLSTSRDRHPQDINIRNFTTSSAHSLPSKEENSPQPPLYASNLTVLLPAFSGTVNVLVIGEPPTVGTKATTFPTPFTITFAYLCVLSPFTYAILIVLVVATVLETFGKVNVPDDVPPR